ncbi:phasin family protein [Microvirga sp. HBU67558]|uniref:phasin family protein n=1 Tax=Microvirga TaxID=186650 RepID=UPI001B374B01|nr:MULTISPECIES: phasin family protein [unclassified Microvirga]MBQ0822885.1 phasin family protein [Microvirga sp. HBU67558]
MATMPKSSGTSDTLRSGAVFSMSGDSGRALANAAETWFTAAAECQREMMSFVSMRLEKDAETTREMMGCRNPADVTAIQSRWMEETLHDYNSEMTKLMTICTRSVNGGGGTGR